LREGRASGASCTIKAQPLQLGAAGRAKASGETRTWVAFFWAIKAGRLRPPGACLDGTRVFRRGLSL